jgi:hypothetical protein
LLKQECQNQTTLSGILWESALYQNLLDLKEKYHIESPIEKPLRDAAEKKLIEIILTKEIEKETTPYPSYSSLNFVNNCFTVLFLAHASIRLFAPLKSRIGAEFAED